MISSAITIQPSPARVRRFRANDPAYLAGTHVRVAVVRTAGRRIYVENLAGEFWWLHRDDLEHPDDRRDRQLADYLADRPQEPGGDGPHWEEAGLTDVLRLALALGVSRSDIISAPSS